MLTGVDLALQKPMYFFLANFSSLEIFYVSVILPRILVSIWSQNRGVSLLDCALQICFFLILGTTECFLLAVMSYDHYMAICNSLHCSLVMNPRKCIQLATGSWLSGSQYRQDKHVKYFLCTSVILTKFSISSVSYSPLSN
jgi:olfactory receptor